LAVDARYSAFPLAPVSSAMIVAAGQGLPRPLRACAEPAAGFELDLDRGAGPITSPAPVSREIWELRMH
jgi:hypothetical protein